MIDKSSQFFAILTAVGEAKHASAIALGLDWMFTEMGLGDANGTDPLPDRLQTQLINEWRRAPINQIRVDSANPNTVITEQIIPPDVGGHWIREIGLYDVDGDLVAVANCAPSYKPLLAQGTGKTQVVRMNFIVSSSANIVLKIDPAVVLATREYVDLAISEALAKLDAKQSVRVATTIDLTLSNVQTIDDVALVVGDRVLVTAQAEPMDNGLYIVSAEGWTRAADADSSLEVTSGLFVHVEEGSAHGDSLWQLVTNAPITLGTTGLQFEQIAGASGVIAGTYRSVTVDLLGRVIAGTNPTTLDGYGITDALAADKNLADLVDVVEARDNLGLGTVATRDTGVEDNQVPAMVSRAGLGGLGYGEEGLLAKTIDFNTYAARNGETVFVSASSPNGPPNSDKATAIAEFFSGATGCIQQRVTLTADPGDGFEGQVWQRVRSHLSQPWGAWVEVTASKANEAGEGTIRIATDDEVDAGISDDSAITPLKLKNKAQSSKTDDAPDTLLLTGAYGMGGGGIFLPEGTDLDSIVSYGVYRFTKGLNMPVGFDHSMVFVMVGSDVVTQMAISLNGIMATRAFVVGAPEGWGLWNIQWGNANLDLNAIFSLPIGVPIPWPTEIPPARCLALNGQPFNTVSFPELAIVYPSGVLLDLRGEWIRGWDAYRGVDPGRALLSSQAGMIEAHDHVAAVGAGQNILGGGGVPAPTVGSTGTSVTGGSETRPRNVALHFICRAH